MLLVAWVLRGTTLKPMQILSIPDTQFLKPTVIATRKAPRGLENHTKPLKTHAYSSNYCSQGGAERTNERALLSLSRPSEEEALVSHALAQLRLARSHARHETKTKTKRSRSPDSGLVAYSLPQTSDIYIYIYITQHMLIRVRGYIGDYIVISI